MWTRDLQLVADSNSFALAHGKPFAQSDGFSDSNRQSYPHPGFFVGLHQQRGFARVHGGGCPDQC